MPITSPTLIPRPPIIPLVLPRAPQVNPLPSARLDRYPGRMDIRRDLQRDLEDLSDEETELEDATGAIRNRGFGSLIPIGRHTTQLEEKNDADDESESSEMVQSGGGPSVTEEAEAEEQDESGRDLDASMEDMDEEREATSDTEDANDVTDDYERSSDA